MAAVSESSNASVDVPQFRLPPSMHHPRNTTVLLGTARALDRASCEHLLAEVVFVLSDIAIPASNRLVLAYHNVLCDLVEKPGSVSKNVSFQPCISYLKSCDTTTTPPLKALIASARESIVGISKPLVGSSSKSMFGPSIARRAKTIRLF